MNEAGSGMRDSGFWSRTLPVKLSEKVKKMLKGNELVNVPIT